MSKEFAQYTLNYFEKRWNIIHKQNHNPKDKRKHISGWATPRPKKWNEKHNILIQIHFSDKVSCLKSCLWSNFDQISFGILSTMVALNLLCRSTASSLPMIRTTTTIAEVRLGSLVSCLGTTGPIVVPFSRLSRLPWGQRSSVWTSAQTSPGLVSTRLPAVSSLTGRLAHISILRSWMRSTSSISLW
jgi:hypothetical protein